MKLTSKLAEEPQGGGGGRSSCVNAACNNN
jgi:hypothetical protein